MAATGARCTDLSRRGVGQKGLRAVQAASRAKASRAKTQALPVGIAVIFAVLVLLALPGAPQTGFLLGSSGTLRLHRAPAVTRRVATPETLLSRSSIDLVRSQNKAGFKMNGLTRRLRDARFEASALDDHVSVQVDGLQQLRRVDVQRGAVEVAGGHQELASALLGALQIAHDDSYASTKGDVWQLYQTNSALIQAPFTQIGIGGMAEDPWENVTADEESLQMAAELFENFDEDGNGYWCLHETSRAQHATEGTEMAEDAFTSLVIASAPNGGRDLTEEDLALGLSKAQVIELYTDGDLQRQLGFVLDVRRDHTMVFRTTSNEDVPVPPLSVNSLSSAPPAPSPLLMLD